MQLRQKFSGYTVDSQKNFGYNSLTELNQGNKKPNPPRISPFCGPIADILLADTYIIAVRFKFVKIKFLITQKEGQKLDIKGA